MRLIQTHTQQPIFKKNNELNSEQIQILQLSVRDSNTTVTCGISDWLAPDSVGNSWESSFLKTFNISGNYIKGIYKWRNIYQEIY